MKRWSEPEPQTGGAVASKGMSEMVTVRSAGSARSPFARSAAVWIGVGVAAWAVSLALTTEPPLTDASTVSWTVLAVVVLVSMTVSLAEPFRPLSNMIAAAAIVVTLGGWAALIFHDDRWSVLTFALYALCFAKGRTLGVVLAAVVSGIWLVAWIDADGPSWTLLIPVRGLRRWRDHVGHDLPGRRRERSPGSAHRPTGRQHVKTSPHLNANGGRSRSGPALPARSTTRWHKDSPRSCC